MNRDQILALKPSRQANIYIHTRLMGNKAWGHHRGSGNDKYVFVQFAPEQPKRKGVTFWEMSMDEFDFHNMVVADVPDYTGSITAAIEMLEKFDGYQITKMHSVISEKEMMYRVIVKANKYVAHGDKLPLTACQAALIATLDPRGGDNGAAHD
ncbi:hypothetical protein PA598K_01439 [Paenibacillus sp. 598K]|uniref:hypothetical protein n=1 Tax=Paenibacillus sp. 598K TaxID=1117987 RepID=UPI000FFAA665|nr:hypothetical protein [Paenibacillus sp. 598K]GBF73154.1 hypothetical protein PA598K_01439 [Paenibacillus sp. 598K]